MAKKSDGNANLAGDRGARIVVINADKATILLFHPGDAEFVFLKREHRRKKRRRRIGWRKRRRSEGGRRMRGKRLAHTWSGTRECSSHSIRRI